MWVGPNLTSLEEGFKKHTHTHTHTVGGANTERVAAYKPRIEASEETNPAGKLNLDFQPLGCQENNILLFKPPALEN